MWKPFTAEPFGSVRDDVYALIESEAATFLL